MLTLYKINKLLFNIVEPPSQKYQYQGLFQNWWFTSIFFPQKVFKIFKSYSSAPCRDRVTTRSSYHIYILSRLYVRLAAIKWLVTEMWSISNKVATDFNSFQPTPSPSTYSPLLQPTPFPLQYIPLYVYIHITCHPFQQLRHFCFYFFHRLEICSILCTFHFLGTEWWHGAEYRGCFCEGMRSVWFRIRYPFKRGN